MIGPGARLVGPEGRFPQPQQNALDDVAPVDGAGDGLPYLFILEERMLQIETQEIVDRGQITVFVEGFRPLFPRCLAQVLLLLPLLAYTRVTIAYFYATEKTALSYVLVFSEPVLTFAVLLILPQLLKLTGVWLAIPAAQALTFCIAVPARRRTQRARELPA